MNMDATCRQMGGFICSFYPRRSLLLCNLWCVVVSFYCHSHQLIDRPVIKLSRFVWMVVFSLVSGGSITGYTNLDSSTFNSSARGNPPAQASRNHLRDQH